MRVIRRFAAVCILGFVTAQSPAELIRVLSFNVESYNSPGSASYNALVRIVQALDPDILLIQEASNDAGRAAFETQFAPAYPFRMLGQADGGGNRQQTFSRWPLMNPANLFAGGFTRPTIRVDVDSDPDNPGAEFRLYNAHFKSGFTDDDYALRAAMAARIRQDIDVLRSSRPDMRIIVGGDFNEQPSDIAFDSLRLPQYNLVFLDERDPFTLSFATRLSSGRNIDHFLFSSTVNCAVQETVVFNTSTWQPGPPAPALFNDSIIASDHLAIYLEFDLIPFVAGDANGDGIITPGDISGFVLALTNLDLFRAVFPCVEPLEVADINADGVISPSDIAPFVELLVGG